MRNNHLDRETRTVNETGIPPPTLLEQVLQLHGTLRHTLASLRVTPLQAGVMLYLHRHGAATLKDVAAALYVTPPPANQGMKDLVTKRWVTKQQVAHDDRALC